MEKTTCTINPEEASAQSSNDSSFIDDAGAKEVKDPTKGCAMVDGKQVWSNENVRKVAQPVKTTLTIKMVKNDLQVAAAALSSLQETKFEKRSEARAHFEELYCVFMRFKTGVMPTAADKFEEIRALTGSYLDVMHDIGTFI